MWSLKRAVCLPCQRLVSDLHCFAGDLGKESLDEGLVFVCETHVVGFCLLYCTPTMDVLFIGLYAGLHLPVWGVAKIVFHIKIWPLPWDWLVWLENAWQIMCIPIHGHAIDWFPVKHFRGGNNAILQPNFIFEFIFRMGVTKQHWIYSKIVFLSLTWEAVFSQEVSSASTPDSNADTAARVCIWPQKEGDFFHYLCLFRLLIDDRRIYSLCMVVWRSFVVGLY